MKWSVACLVVMALVASSVCARRQRRQVPKGMGAPPGFATPPKGFGSSDIKDFMMGDVKNQAAMGVPIDPTKIDSIQSGGPEAAGTGVEIANPSKEKIDGLQTPPADIAGAPPA